MDQQNLGAGGPANTPPFGTQRTAVDTAADHQIPAETGGTTETEREMERTRDMLAKSAAPVMAEKAQEALEETASRMANDPQVKEQMKRTATAVQHDAQRMAKEKVGEMAGKAEDRVNQKMNQAADAIDNAAQRLDDLANRQTQGATGPKARAGEMAHTAADTMETVANYLRSNDVQGLRRDMERQLNERPLQTLLVAVAAGWLVGKILR
jgi:hypothetical protein